MSTISLTNTRRRTEAGFAMVMLAISSFAIVLVVGFATDVGSWYLNASRLQRTSDAAALAGASSLPDVDAARAAADFTLRANDTQDGVDHKSIEYETTADQFEVTVRDDAVSTYFIRMIIPKLSIERTSTAARPSASPALGSPYNILGSGDLAISGIPKQNFWLAINGFCSPKEDGDYFSAIWDGNKGPMTSTLDSNHNFVPGAGATHNCVGPQTNENYNPSGYSYFVDVPKPPHAGDTVTLRVYDPAFGVEYATPDKQLTFDNDKYPSLTTQYVVWNTNGTPENDTDDTRLASYNVVPDIGVAQASAWVDLYTIPSSMLAKGGQFRVQVRNQKLAALPQNVIDGAIGTNAFSLGAFRSWAPGGCDARQSDTCPRFYGRGALSVFNNLAGSAGDKVTLYFAEIDPAYVGQEFSVFLWDPGEGVQKIELLGPDDTPINFDWSTSPPTPGYSGVNSAYLDTSGDGPASGPNLSNPYKFNDRLVVMRVTLPLDYPDMVADAGGDQWLRLRYTVGSAPGDRTTWGVDLDSSPSAPPHLMRSR